MPIITNDQLLFEMPKMKKGTPKIHHITFSLLNLELLANYTDKEGGKVHFSSNGF